MVVKDGDMSEGINRRLVSFSAIDQVKYVFVRMGLQIVGLLLMLLPLGEDWKNSVEAQLVGFRAIPC